MFSKSCEYGIHAALYIAQHRSENKNIGLKEVAIDQKIPIHFLSKVLQILVKNKILKSTRGINGGFSLSRKANEINLIDIIKAIDGMDIFDKCVIGLKDCSKDNPCAVHEQYIGIKESFMNILTSINLQSLVEDKAIRKSFFPKK
jgi:Rrf2 family iron-sulfur cluster assembly transcriptional regulator